MERRGAGQAPRSHGQVSPGLLRGEASGELTSIQPTNLLESSLRRQGIPTTSAAPDNVVRTSELLCAAQVYGWLPAATLPQMSKLIATRTRPPTAAPGSLCSEVIGAASLYFENVIDLKCACYTVVQHFTACQMPHGSEGFRAGRHHFQA
jgi:hypothetical protein